VIDDSRQSGQFTSLTIGPDGHGLIAYRAFTDGDLRVAHCSNTACSTATTTTVDAVGDTGRYTAIATGVDGFALISYADRESGHLRVTHCSNVFCVPYFRRR
jgi:hypothetical protein